MGTRLCDGVSLVGKFNVTFAFIEPRWSTAQVWLVNFDKGEKVKLKALCVYLSAK